MVISLHMVITYGYHFFTYGYKTRYIFEIMQINKEYLYGHF